MLSGNDAVSEKLLKFHPKPANSLFARPELSENFPDVAELLGQGSRAPEPKRIWLTIVAQFCLRGSSGAQLCLVQNLNILVFICHCCSVSTVKSLKSKSFWGIPCLKDKTGSYCVKSGQTQIFGKKISAYRQYIAEAKCSGWHTHKKNLNDVIPIKRNLFLPQ